MKAVVKRVDGLAMIGKADSNHWVPMDAKVSLNGMDAGTEPMELVLISLGGCTGMDVLSILKKKRVTLDDFAVEIEAERADEHPKVFTVIHVKFLFTGKNIPATAVERAIELSETKYCSIFHMLRKTSQIRIEYEIRET